MGLNRDQALRLIVEACPKLEKVHIQINRMRLLGPGLFRALSMTPTLKVIHFEGNTNSDGAHTDMSILRKLLASVPQVPSPVGRPV